MWSGTFLDRLGPATKEDQYISVAWIGYLDGQMNKRKGDGGDNTSDCSNLPESLFAP